MAKTFMVPLRGSPAELVEKVKTVAEEAGATFRGDTVSGTFDGQGVAGSYRMDGSQVTVTITAKPFLLSWSLVESEIRRFFL